MNNHGPHELPHWRPDDPAVTYAPTGREKAAWILWAIVSVPVAWAFDRIRAYLTTPRPSWHTLAHVAFALFCGVWAYRGLTQAWGLTVGAARAEASTGERGPMPAGTAGAERAADLATSAHDSATATAAALRAAPLPDAGIVASPPREPLPAWLPPSVTRWEPHIRAASARYGVDPALIAIIVTVESGGDPDAVSRDVNGNAIAHGLCQIVPRYHARINESPGPYDPTHNIDVGTEFLAGLLKTYAVASDDDWRQTIDKAVGFYNGGGRGAGDDPLPESRSYRRWVGGMWAERHDAESPTYAAWLAAGGVRLVDKASAHLEAGR